MQDHVISKANPKTAAHKKRLEKALRQDASACDACWTCALALLPVDMLDPFRFVDGKVYCSRCVPLLTGSRRTHRA